MPPCVWASLPDAASRARLSPPKPAAPAYASSLEVLEKVSATFPEEDRFPAAGRDEAHRRRRPPRCFGDINAYHGESFRYRAFLVDENLTGKLTGDAATLIHMMNTNTFCSAVMELKNAGEASSFGEIYKEIVPGQPRFGCASFPDTSVVPSLGELRPHRLRCRRPDRSCSRTVPSLWGQRFW